MGGNHQIANNGQPINNLSSIKTFSGLTGYWQPKPNDIIRAIYVADDKVYVGGKFTTIQNRYQPYFASLDLFNSGKALKISSLNKIDVCKGDSLEIIGTDFIQISSVKLGNADLKFKVKSTTSISVLIDTALIGKITIANTLGQDVSLQTVNVKSSPTVSVNNASICVGGTGATFTATTNANNPSYVWSGNGTGANSTTTGTTAGNYTVTVT
ncbi:MAG: hypothetical protein RLZZ414_275, partial [Bacteroidota bacterium]